MLEKLWISAIAVQCPETQRTDVPTRMPWKLIKVTSSPSQMQTSLSSNNNKHGHPQKCMHEVITSETGLDKADEQ